MLQLALQIQRYPANDTLRARRLVMGIMELTHARIGLWSRLNLDIRFQLGEGAAPSCRVPRLTVVPHHPQDGAPETHPIVLAETPDLARLAQHHLQHPIQSDDPRLTASIRRALAHRPPERYRAWCEVDPEKAAETGTAINSGHDDLPPKTPPRHPPETLDIGSTLTSLRQHTPGTFSLIQLHRSTGVSPFDDDTRAILMLLHSMMTA